MGDKKKVPVLDTNKSSCFMCRQEIGSEEEEDDDKIPSGGILPFKLLKEYMNVDFGDVLNLISLLIPSSSSSTSSTSSPLKKGSLEFGVFLCAQCSAPVTEEFSQLLEQLQLIRLQVEACVGKMQELMVVTAAEDPEVVSKHGQQRVAVVPSRSEEEDRRGDWVKATLGDNVRKELLDKCCSKFTRETSPARVMLTKFGGDHHVRQIGHRPAKTEDIPAPSSPVHQELTEIKRRIREETDESTGSPVVITEILLSDGRQVSFRKLEPDQFKCQVCSKLVYAHNNSLEAHNLRHRKGGGPEASFRCQLCGKCFPQFSHIQDHTYTDHLSSFFADYKEPKLSPIEFESIVSQLFEELLLHIPKGATTGGGGYSCSLCANKAPGGNTPKPKPKMHNHLIRMHMDKLVLMLLNLQQENRPLFLAAPLPKTGIHQSGGEDCTTFRRQLPNVLLQCRDSLIVVPRQQLRVRHKAEAGAAVGRLDVGGGGDGTSFCLSPLQEHFTSLPDGKRKCNMCSTIIPPNAARDHMKWHSSSSSRNGRHDGTNTKHSKYEGVFDLADSNSLLADINMVLGLPPPESCGPPSRNEIPIECDVIIEQIPFKKLPDGKYQCGICSEILADRKNVYSHRFMHVGGGVAPAPLKCDFCDKSFSRDSDVQNHTVLEHKSSLFLGHKDPKLTSSQFEEIVANLFNTLNVRAAGPRKYKCCFCDTDAGDAAGRGGMRKNQLFCHVAHAHMSKLVPKLMILQAEVVYKQQQVGKLASLEKTATKARTTATPTYNMRHSISILGMKKSARLTETEANGGMAAAMDVDESNQSFTFTTTQSKSTLKKKEPCLYCRQPFSNQQECDHHTAAVHKRQIFDAYKNPQFCDSEFVNLVESLVKNYIKTTGGGGRGGGGDFSISCGMCRARFPSRGDAESHIVHSHTKYIGIEAVMLQAKNTNKQGSRSRRDRDRGDDHVIVKIKNERLEVGKVESGGEAANDLLADINSIIGA